MPTGVTFDEAVALIEAAKTPSDLFGQPTAADIDGYLSTAKLTFKNLARTVHPDANPLPNADEAFAKLASLWAVIEQRAKSGTLGSLIVKTKTREYAFGDDFVRGDIANVYPATASVEPNGVVLKIVRKPQNADLLTREVKALERLDEEANPKLRDWASRLVESFRYTSPDGKQRQTNVLERLDGFYTLTDVKKAYPSGIDARDAAWMWRRLLIALGWAHEAGVIHGAVLPSNIMIWPEAHGLILIDWCYSVIDDGSIPAVSSRYESFYPEEVKDKGPAGPETDIYMAAKVLRFLLNAAAPRQIRAFIKGCTLTSAASRPKHAWQLLEEFDELIERLWGPRRFRHFEMPKA